MVKSMENLNSESLSDDKDKDNERFQFLGNFFCKKSLTWTILSNFHVSYPSRSLDWPVPNTSLGGWSVCERKLWCLWWWIHWGSRCFPGVELSLFMCVYSPGIFRNPGWILGNIVTRFLFCNKMLGPDESPDQLESYKWTGEPCVGGGVTQYHKWH